MQTTKKTALNITLVCQHPSSQWQGKWAEKRASGLPIAHAAYWIGGRDEATQMKIRDTWYGMQLTHGSDLMCPLTAL